MLDKIEPNLLWYQRLTVAAALLMLLPLPIMQYVGEEGLMAMKSYEMYVRGDYLHPSILGTIWPHSPLWHWPVIGISNLIGWQHVDISVRLVSVFSSWLTAAMAGFTAAWLFKHRTEAGWLAALIYLTMGEVAFWYGWLGYLDATFGLFVFSSIALLWRAIAEESLKWFIISLLLVSLAFMTKNITAYALYGFSGLILLWQLQRWQLLKKPLFLLFGLSALIVPWLQQTYVVLPGANTASVSINDALRNFSGFGLLDYLQHWLSYPLLFIGRAFPLTLFFIWLWLRRKFIYTADDSIKVAALILLACLLPFWLSAGATPRYLIPFYGLAALIITGLSLQLDRKQLQTAIKLVALIIMLKIPFSLAILPYIKDWRPERDVKVVAEEIMQISKDAPLQSQNDVATGLAIAAYIDVWRQDKPPVTWYAGKATGLYILAEVETPEFGQLVKHWRLRGDHVYLYWKAEN